MSAYRAFEATGVHHLRLVERELVDPEPGHVRLRVEACGVRHSDVLAVEGLRSDPSRPVVPGHEIVGVIDAVGAGVTAWRSGDRVGVGFLNGHCWECEPCRRGDFVNCLNQQQTGTTIDGGYAEVTYARASGLQYTTHNTPEITTWLAKRPRFHVHFTPTGSSWINQVERWFGLLTDKLIRRGVHTSVKVLEDDIKAWIDTWNQNPRPFTWTKSADEILKSLAD